MKSWFSELFNSILRKYSPLKRLGRNIRTSIATGCSNRNVNMVAPKATFSVIIPKIRKASLPPRSRVVQISATLGYQGLQRYIFDFVKCITPPRRTNTPVIETDRERAKPFVNITSTKEDDISAGLSRSVCAALLVFIFPSSVQSLHEICPSAG